MYITNACVVYGLFASLTSPMWKLSLLFEALLQTLNNRHHVIRADWTRYRASHRCFECCAPAVDGHLLASHSTTSCLHLSGIEYSDLHALPLATPFGPQGTA